MLNRGKILIKGSLENLLICTMAITVDDLVDTEFFGRLVTFEGENAHLAPSQHLLSLSCLASALSAIRIKAK